MLLLVILTLSVASFATCSHDFIVPKIQVLSPKELIVNVPKYEDLNLVTIRIGIRRAGAELEDLERGQNFINRDDQNRMFVYDERLKLEKGDIVNYLIAFRGPEGYEAQTGSYVFDGVYLKSPSRRRRFLTEASSTGSDMEETSTVAIESRFGGGEWAPRHYWNHGHNHGFHHGGGFGHPPNGFGPPPNGFGPPPRPFRFSHHRHHHHGHNFGHDCNFNHDNDYDSSDSGDNYEEDSSTKTQTTPTTSTSTPFPDIDIRFAKD